MRRTSVLVFMALAMVALPIGSAFAAGWSITAFGGGGVPTGDLADENKGNAKFGYQVGGALDHAVNDMWTLGVDGSYVQNKNDLEGSTQSFSDLSDFDPSLSGSGDVTIDKFKYDTWQFGGHAKYMFPMQKSSMMPYGLVGLGVYNTKAKIEGTVTPTSGSPSNFTGEAKFDSRFGGKVGLGTMFRANDMIKLGLEADYNFISEDKDKAPFESAQYIGIK